MGNSKRQKPSESTWRHDIPGRPLELGEHIWLYGYHAVLAALANPQRQKHRLVVTSKTFLKAFINIFKQFCTMFLCVFVKLSALVNPEHLFVL